MGILFMSYSCSQDELVIDNKNEINQKSGNTQSITLAKGPRVNLLTCPNGIMSRDGDIEAILNTPTNKHLLVFFDMYVQSGGTAINPSYQLIPPYIAGGVLDIPVGSDRGAASFCENEVNPIFIGLGFCKNKSLQKVKKKFKYTISKIIEIPSGNDVTNSFTINPANNQNITTVSYVCPYIGGGYIDNVFKPSD